ncbi:hypothetical protein PC1_0369 [Pectobacterium carotovorum subsp. carotovorum PC1]|uniref:Uncharacterized protein n=1 Tax=Pectobacterium carotovorum subsp. carotovorum (strain PC1) TaxID=561230 RepID=C6DJL5_PECCP|nr:hypothetical protein PC1_0369 [Pectobacterium carotovorum subsp. carotovorum PC1]
MGSSLFRINALAGVTFGEYKDYKTEFHFFYQRGFYDYWQCPPP